MKSECVAIVFSVVAVVGCTSIPSRPLSSEEQSLVGIWMTKQQVQNVGRVRAVQQMLPSRQGNLLAHTPKGMVCGGIRWEAVNGRLHGAGFPANDDWSAYRLDDGGNTMILDGINGRITWKRYSHSPYHPLNEAFEAADSAGAPGSAPPGMLDFMLLDMKRDLKRNEALAAMGDERAAEYVRIFKPQIEFHERTKLDNMRKFQEDRARRYPID